MGHAVPDLLIKPVVYGEFRICNSAESILLIKPAVYEEFGRRGFKTPKLLIKPVVYEGFACVTPII